MRKNLLLLVLVLIGASILTACGGEETDKSDSSEVSGKSEQVLNVSINSEPDTLDVARASDVNGYTVLIQCMENLTRLEVDEEGNDVVAPGIAKSWETSDDGLEWTFYLRDAKWSDGEPVTADDFVYGVQRTLDPETASPIASQLTPIKNAEEIINNELDVSKAGIEAIDKKTLKIELEKPQAHFIDLTYDRMFQPQRKDVVEEHGESYGTEADKLVFNGPFVIDDWVHNNIITLSKNEKYWDKDSVNLNEINIKIIGEESAVMGEFINSNIDVVDASSAEWIDKLDQEDGLNKLRDHQVRTSYMFFNQENELFSNNKVRQAFSIVLDRETIQNDIYQDLYEAAYGWVAPPIDIGDENYREKAGDPVKDLIEENPEPKELLIEGLKELGKSEEPSDITVELMTPSQEGREFPEFLQQLYNEELGINIEIDSAEWPVFQERNRQLDYEMGYKSRGGYYNDPLTLLDIWVTGTGIIPTGWSNERYDRLIEKSSTSIDNEERFEMLNEAERILLKKDATIAPYLYHMRNIYTHEYVEGVMHPAFGPPLYKYGYIDK
ncbi:peptide ABC transporter substrate-binding protein [Natranaerobius trueperi]|uniref:Peptide ABC transporter substrate-binding protein n=1 Tax=Natranaerobius trueperi TaxID=759412 RepID=A0A226BXP7_9FIRM|nr:peptide ABC transporter substrate-binding protein [Natranaerobius trueperi]OWZ83691.1 peptide ABC transporter substrate-binding protein [Natranaerobius trueperi]